MIITFQSKATGHITMLGADALKLIRLMGHSGTVPGAIAAEDLSAAIDRLAAAVEQAQQEAAAQKTDDADNDSERKVGLAQRAFPLLELLKTARAEEVPVMWTK
jgi:hypothetical protein